MSTMMAGPVTLVRKHCCMWSVRLVPGAAMAWAALLTSASSLCVEVSYVSFCELVGDVGVGILSLVVLTDLPCCFSTCSASMAMDSASVTSS